jgi:16S rRNA (cytosine1402-N4)-methyltransferase
VPPPVFTHLPVLLSAVTEGLNICSNGIYIDGTFGRGGHSKAILEKLEKSGRLFAIDKDSDAIEAAKKIDDPRFKIFQGSFRDIKNLTEKEEISGNVSGILLDLGVSSPQFDDAARGFSFRLEGPLDMRMNKSQGWPLSEWLKTVKEETLRQIIKEYGEERFAKKIAKSIIEERDKKEITTTTELAEIVAKAHPAWEWGKHPATQTFQALRIFINNELEDLKIALSQCLDLLKPGGRLLVISFHSLEDRLVKQFIQKEVHGDKNTRKLPLREAELNIRLRIIGKAIRPSAFEIEQNPRARSAVLRIVEKIK